MVRSQRLDPWSKHPRDKPRQQISGQTLHSYPRVNEQPTRNSAEVARRGPKEPREQSTHYPHSHSAPEVRVSTSLTSVSKGNGPVQ
ncbi:hypothetical protein ABIE13_001309 [Ottowia thiooxydans]|uniref:Uncharacterized protein n=1 Tax=Ottowia thiooxydans TaxID=219182 RepID=A0ABV2Q592_9BURK